MALTQQQKLDIIKKFGKNAQDTGRTEVQIAILTEEIIALTKHMISNKKDKISKSGLYAKVARRKNLLAYLERNDIESYRKIIKELNLRG